VLDGDKFSDRNDEMGRTRLQRDTSGRPSSVTGPEPGSEWRHGFRAVGVAVSQLAAPIVAKRGSGVLVRLKAEWATIAGPEWGNMTWPTALSRDGVLKLRAVPGAALELQHRAPLLIERINIFFGRSIITRLAIVQGLLPLAPPPNRLLPRPLTPDEMRALDEQLREIADPELRNALARLGQAVIDAED
jgi:hypothetical protein